MKRSDETPLQASFIQFEIQMEIGAGEFNLHAKQRVYSCFPKAGARATVARAPLPSPKRQYHSTPNVLTGSGQLTLWIRWSSGNKPFGRLRRSVRLVDGIDVRTMAAEDSQWRFECLSTGHFRRLARE